MSILPNVSLFLLVIRTLCNNVVNCVGDDGWIRATGPKGDTESTGDTVENSATGVLVQVIKHRVRRQYPGIYDHSDNNTIRLGDN